ncbi:hypothetical protein ANT_26060 [Anaerolinea thermophila UNI-1]|uniref:Uncharacterized protein n=1 Tax=Anaerolinea thermophila (strain DSM 14523 / JCM 11388 / NBRC 100420 / UNI-1) TaxID=926569 RepID=E8N083_ANATU|nr:hypothetical protein ANT_26060 [Anaerolinea thermophila UNI-1]
MLLIVLAKIYGEERPSGIAECAKHRTEMLVEWLKLKRNSMLHHSTYRRILAEVVNVEELEHIQHIYLSGEKSFGTQVLVSIDGKVLRRTLDDSQ